MYNSALVGPGTSGVYPIPVFPVSGGEVSKSRQRGQDVEAKSRQNEMIAAPSCPGYMMGQSVGTVALPLIEVLPSKKKPAATTDSVLVWSIIFAISSLASVIGGFAITRLSM